MAVPLTVDLDDVTTWPQAVVAFADEAAQRMRGVTEYTPDLPGELVDREREFQGLLSEHKLLAFHCTRLFDHEVAAIRRGGLRRLSRELVIEKIEQGHALGLLSDRERDRCLAGNVYAIENAVEAREDKVCLVVGRAIFDCTAHGLSPLLGGWGGEATNGGPGPADDPELSRLGKPAIVAAAVEVPAPEPGALLGALYSAPSLAKIFVGAQLGLQDACGEIHSRADVQAEDVVAIWHPGDAEYDHYRELPSS